MIVSLNCLLFNVKPICCKSLPLKTQFIIRVLHILNIQSSCISIVHSVNHNQQHPVHPSAFTGNNTSSVVCSSQVWSCRNDYCDNNYFNAYLTEKAETLETFRFFIECFSYTLNIWMTSEKNCSYLFYNKFTVRFLLQQF